MSESSTQEYALEAIAVARTKLDAVSEERREEFRRHSEDRRYKLRKDLKELLDQRKVPMIALIREATGCHLAQAKSIVNFISNPDQQSPTMTARDAKAVIASRLTPIEYHQAMEALEIPYAGE